MNLQNNRYLPIPPRAWSRVQNSCSLTTDTNTTDINTLLLGEKNAMLNKGNVLQYKANSSNLTQAQKYSKIAQGKWTNRNTTWATQSSRGYTNPNTTSLKRSGNVTNVAIDPITGAIIGPTTAPITCPTFITTINEGLPSNIEAGGSTDEPEIPPSIPPTPASETFPPIIGDTPIEPIVIQDEGVLICSIQENICTGDTKSSISQQLCHPTSDSDVPGTIQLLCWNDGTPTWYPRSRYIMTNSTNKWPINAVLSSSIRPFAPTITSITSNLNIVTLTWTLSENCLPISFFNIFQNGILVQSVPETIFTTDIVVDNCNTYEYFITAVTNGSNISSEPSNVVSIIIFDKNCIYSIAGDTNNYTEQISGNNYILTFNTNTNSNGIFNITFFVSLNNVTFKLVGGGGGGRGSGYYFPAPLNTKILTGGVGGGGAASIQSNTNVLQFSSFDLVVGKGGQGGVAGSASQFPTPTPTGSPGNVTSVTSPTFTSNAPGGKTSDGFTEYDTTLGTGYVSNGVLSSDTPTSNGDSITLTIGGGTGKEADKPVSTGSGIYSISSGSANGYINGGDGLNAIGSLLYGGGGGTTLISYSFAKITFSGSLVSLNNLGGLEGITVEALKPSYLPGNQKYEGTTIGHIGIPGPGSGGGGGGLFWQVIGDDYFGNGGNGGDGLIIITFTYP